MDRTAGGMGFCSVLTLIFVVLKLVGVIDWSWLWVLCPLWIVTGAALVVVILIVELFLVASILGRILK